MSAPAGPTPAVRVVTVLAVLLVAAVAAVASYAHMQHLASRAGEDWRSYLLPLSVDGMVVAAGMVLLTRSRAGTAAGWLPWAALLGGVAASLFANVASAEPTVTARVIAAWPPLAFAVAFELLLQQRRPVEVVPPVSENVSADRSVSTPARGAGEPAAEVWRPVVATRTPATGSDSYGPDITPVEPRTSPIPERKTDPLLARTAQLVAAARADGRPAGRRTIARKLGVSEHQAAQLLARANGSGS